MMLGVLVALIPGILVYIYFFGWGVIVNITLAVLIAVVCEALMLRLRHRPLKPYLLDGSAGVTAVLFAGPLVADFRRHCLCYHYRQAPVRWPWVQPVQPCHGRLCHPVDCLSERNDGLATGGYA